MSGAMCAKFQYVVLVALLAVAVTQRRGTLGQQPPASRDEGALPQVIGVVGVGTIGSALVRGILSAKALPSLPTFVLSPRDAAKVAALEAEFPSHVQVAGDDQQVVDLSDWVVLALPGGVAVDVLADLRFRPEQKVISLIAAVRFQQLQQLLGQGVECTRAMPMPAISKQQGATLGFPAKPYAETLFSVMGSYIAAANEEDFIRLQAAGAFMGDFYERQLTIQQWLIAHGTDPQVAASYIGGVFAAFAADSMVAGPGTFQHLVEAQTPGGLNEMVVKEQRVAGAYAAVNQSLDAVYARLVPSSHTSTEVFV